MAKKWDKEHWDEMHLLYSFYMIGVLDDPCLERVTLNVLCKV